MVNRVVKCDHNLDVIGIGIGVPTQWLMILSITYFLLTGLC